MERKVTMCIFFSLHRRAISNWVSRCMVGDSHLIICFCSVAVLRAVFTGNNCGIRLGFFLVNARYLLVSLRLPFSFNNHFFL